MANRARRRKADDAYFAQGIHEEVLDQLAKVNARNVIAVVAENLVRRNRGDAAFLELPSGALLDRAGSPPRSNSATAAIRPNGSRANVGSLQVDWIVVAKQPNNGTATASATIRVMASKKSENAEARMTNSFSYACAESKLRLGGRAAYESEHDQVRAWLFYLSVQSLRRRAKIEQKPRGR